MIFSPTTEAGISFSSDSRRSRSISSMNSSMLFMLMVRFSQAFSMPERTFSRLKSSRRPSFFMIMIGISSMCSYVVNRRLHVKHSRRRRMTLASLLNLESITLFSISLQYGHFIPRPPPLRRLIWMDSLRGCPPPNVAL
jgi:hypothetical protein